VSKNCCGSAKYSLWRKSTRSELCCCKQYIKTLEIITVKFSRLGHQVSRICASLLKNKQMSFTHYSIPSADTNILPITLSSASSCIQLHQTPIFQRRLHPLALPATLYFSLHITTMSCTTFNVTDTFVSSLSFASLLIENICSSAVLLYPAVLVILLVTGNIGRLETTGKICQFEVTENSLFYWSQPLNVHQSTHTYILLSVLIFPKWSRG
jgi:hypothetical protein